MKQILAIDVDGTICGQAYNQGEPIPGSQDFVRALSTKYDILIYSCRTNSELFRTNANFLRRDLAEWLDKYGFIYHDIWIGQGKPDCFKFLDDKNIVCNPESDSSCYERIKKQLL